MYLLVPTRLSESAALFLHVEGHRGRPLSMACIVHMLYSKTITYECIRECAVRLSCMHQGVCCKTIMYASGSVL